MIAKHHPSSRSSFIFMHLQRGEMFLDKAKKWTFMNTFFFRTSTPI